MARAAPRDRGASPASGSCAETHPAIPWDGVARPWRGSRSPTSRCVSHKYVERRMVASLAQPRNRRLTLEHRLWMGQERRDRPVVGNRPELTEDLGETGELLVAPVELERREHTAV